MTSRTATIGALAALASALPAAAQGPDPTPCTTMVIDATVENAFAIGAGETQRDFCSLGTIPTTSGPYNCRWGDLYNIPEYALNWTALTSQPPALLDFLELVSSSGVPDTELILRQDLGIPPPDLYPSSTLSFNGPQESVLARELNRGLQSRPQSIADLTEVFFCARLRQNAAGRFVTVDRSASTPATPCFTRAGAAAWEPCTNGDPNLRAIGIGGHVAPIAGYGSSDQVVFPHQTAAWAILKSYYTGPPLPSNAPSGTNTFRFQITHTVPNPIVAHIHRGYPGENGPVVLTFPSAQSPIDLDGYVLTNSEIQDLAANRLYFDIHNAAHPEGAVRGPILPAQPGIFVDGFESGDTSAWSSSIP